MLLLLAVFCCTQKRTAKVNSMRAHCAALFHTPPVSALQERVQAYVAAVWDELAAWKLEQRDARDVRTHLQWPRHSGSSHPKAQGLHSHVPPPNALS